MALSAVSYAADGIVTDFVLSFTLGYLRKEHIQVEQRLDGEIEFTIIPNTEWIFINQDQGIRFNVAPVNLSSIRLRRITPNNLLIHDYEDGSLVIEENLDESNKQSIMLMHEAIDGFSDLGAGSDLDMAGLRIVNLGNPIADGDAVNFGTFNLAVPVIEAARDQGVSAVQTQEGLSVTAVLDEGTTQLAAINILKTSIDQSVIDVAADELSVTNQKNDFDDKYIGEVGSLPSPAGRPEGQLAFLTGTGFYTISLSSWVLVIASAQVDINTTAIARQVTGFARMNSTVTAIGPVTHGLTEVTENITFDGTKWTAQDEGYYAITWEGLTASTANVRVTLTKNAVAQPSIADPSAYLAMAFTSGASGNRPITITNVVHLAVSDYIELRLMEGELFASATNAFGNFSIHRI